ncbi:MAG: InlB B-repeat-containing protein [Ruminiclostridium sp.]|nr:InlB B-repeat-containing protein [Ruminiclostridium sp.]
MKRTKHKILSVFLSFCMIVLCMVGMSVTASADTSSWTSGDCTVTYDNDTKTMTVKKTDASSATGNMADYAMDSYDTTASVSPWNDIKGDIQNIVLEEGVTGIGNYAFQNCDSVKNISIPASVTKIGNYAFYSSDPGRTVTFVRPSAESTLVVADIAIYYSATLAYSGDGNYSLYEGDNEIEISGTYKGDILNGKTLTWKLPIFNIIDKSENGTVTATVGSSTTAATKAEVGVSVTLTVTPASGYEFKSIKATVAKNGVETFDDLVTLMGTAEFAGEYETTGYTCKVENGQFVVYNGNTLVTETTSDISGFYAAASYAYFDCGDIQWTFYLTDGKITSIRVIQNVSPYTSLFDGSGESNGTLAPVEIALTTVTAGSKYSFTMPKKTVTIMAEFEESDHTHSFTYAVGTGDSANTITATCTGDGDCDITTGKTLTISAPTSLTYDGTAKAATLSTGYNTTAFPGTYTIEYYQGTTKLSSAPTDAGTYTAKVTVGTGTGAATASVDFTIAPKPLTADNVIVATAPALTYDGTAKTPAVTVKDGTKTLTENTDYTITYSDNINAGETAKATVTGKGNYTGSVITNFTIGKADITASAAEVSTAYDGEAHGITVKVTAPTNGYTVKYGTTEGTYDKTASPTIANVKDSPLTVYYQVTADNYETLTGSATVTLTKASQEKPVLSSTNETIEGKADGVITGLTTAMEISKTSATAGFAAVTDTTGTGYAAGTYYVRFTADDNHNASEAAAVIINTGSKITIQFDADGGTPEPAAQELTYNQTVSKPTTDPEKTGYTFKFWSADGEAEYDFSAKLTANITLKAVYTVNKYTLYFDFAGGGSAEYYLEYGETIADYIPTIGQEGYTFLGWDKDIPETMPAEDLTFTAQWKINQYTITFNTNGGTTIAPITQDYGTAITAPANPTRQDYTFTGWNPAIPTTMPAYDLTVNAQWTYNYTVPVYVPTNIVTPTPVTPTETETVTPAAGTFEDITDEEDNAGEAQISTPGSELADAILTDSDRTAMASGEDVKVYLEVEEVKPTAEEEALVEEAITDAGEELEIAMYLDIDLFKKVGGNSAVQIHETNGQIEVSIDLPEGLENNDPTVERSYYVARIHNGEVEIIPAAYDLETGKLSFLTDKFSVYAILFKDRAIVDSDVESDTETEIEIDTDDDTDKTPVENNVDVVVETGEDTNPHTAAPLAGLAVLAMSASAAAAAFTAKKRKNK